jgi:hypothetical protein
MAGTLTGVKWYTSTVLQLAALVTGCCFASGCSF